MSIEKEEAKETLLKLFKINYLKKEASDTSSLEVTNVKIIKYTSESYRLLVSRNNGMLEHWEYNNDIKNWVNLSIINHSNINDPLSSNTIEDFVYYVDPETQLERVFTINGNEYITEYDLMGQCIKKQHLINVTSDSNCIIWSININSTLDKLIIGLTNNNIQIYELSRDNSNILVYNSQLLSSVNNDEKALTITFADNDRHIITGTSLGKIKIHSYENNSIQLIKTLNVDNKKFSHNSKHGNKSKSNYKSKIPIVWCLQYISKYNLIVSGDSNGDLKVWDFKSSTLLQTLSTNNASVVNSNNSGKSSSKVDILNLSFNTSNDCIFTTSLDKKITMFKFLPSNDSDVLKLTLLSTRLINKSLVNVEQGYDLRGLHTLDNFLVVGNEKGEIQIYNQCNNFNTLDNHLSSSKLPLVIKQDDLYVNENLVFNLVNNSSMKIYSLKGSLLSKLNFQPAQGFTVNPRNELLVLHDSSSVNIRCFFLEQIEKTAEHEAGIKVTKVPLENLPNFDDFKSKYDNLRIKSVSFINNDELIMIYQYNTFDFNGNCTVNNLIYKYNVEEMESQPLLIKGFLNSEKENEADEDNDDDEAAEEFANVIISKVDNLKNNRFLVTCESSVFVLHSYNNFLKLQKLYENKANGIQIAKYNEERNTVLILTRNFKIFELNIESGEQTQWSKQNHDSFPKIVLNDIHKSTVVIDIIFLPNQKAIIYTSNWMLTINMTKNLPMKNKKRKYNEILDQETSAVNDEETLDNVSSSTSFSFITKFSMLYKLGLISANDSQPELFLVNQYLMQQSEAKGAGKKSIGGGKYKF